MVYWQKLKRLFKPNSNPFLKIEILHSSKLTKEVINELIQKKTDVLLLKNVLTPHLLKDVESRLTPAAMNTSVAHIGHDGYTLPLPYSMIQPSEQNPNPFAPYLEQAADAQPTIKKILGTELLSELQACIENLALPNPALLPAPGGRHFSPLNLRLLFAGKNGIDIHCENTFLKYLHPALKQHLYNTIDIENALSFVFMLQAPEQGGEFVLFNKDWNTAPVDSALQAYTHRHSTEASFFEELGYGKATHTKITLQAGDLIVFRAAQIWHSINKIEGTVNRITAGGFLAKSIAQNEQLYYWS